MPHDDLTTKDAAAYLSMSPRTLEGWRLDKRGPAFYFHGRRVSYTTQDLDEWLGRHAHVTPENTP